MDLNSLFLKVEHRKKKKNKKKERERRKVFKKGPSLKGLKDREEGMLFLGDASFLWVFLQSP